MIPLALKLKKELHRRIALAQDLLVSELYAVFNEAVLHGGTAIWRCYKGNRFSEDVDVYIQRDVDKINLLFRNLEKKGFIIEKKKVGEKSLYSSLRLDRTYIRFEALFKKSKGELGEYETADGNLITVYTLTPEEFVSEKVDTYLKRSRIRDLYDIFFLLRHVKDTNKIKNRLQAFAREFKKPVDEKELKVLIIEGIVPSAEKMLEYIKKKL